MQVLPVVHESNEVLLPLLPHDGKDLLRLSIQHLALMSNLVCQGLQLCSGDHTNWFCELESEFGNGSVQERYMLSSRRVAKPGLAAHGLGHTQLAPGPSCCILLPP